ncbi:ankyrin repeat domain-containing protein [Sphingosinicella terrae]|jgi:uncharacterized protein|uniref:ankyrin repeat domain-containing protein n=1 Tax=Sphingosinicella terrae TaxID=2172047 RepID=UPI000E0D1BD6|nr:ankyrin repeat domain-containing protein [Sphingosinicella terrae]
MRRMNLHALAVAVLAALAVPVAAQNFSESFNFLKGVRERDGNVVQGMLANPNPAVVNAREASSGEGALHILVRGRDYDWVSYLLARGARPDLPNNDGSTPLMLAAQLGWVEGAELLLQRGANPNQANNRGETALILAVQARELPMVRLLRSRGGDPNLTDSVAGYSALDYARQDRRAAAILRELERQ